MRILKYKKTDRAKSKGQKRHAQNAERVKLHVSTGDTVKVMRGDDKGHVGKVVRVYRKTGRVVVEGANFVKRHRGALTGYPSRAKLFSPLPSFQSNMCTLDALRRQLARTALPFEPTFEKRYPYLDRDLLEFIFAIPRDQLVRPTQRRSLMRRALVGIVPNEILNRKTKAFVARSPLVEVSTNWAHFMGITQDMVSSALGIVDSEGLYAALQKARRSEELPMVILNRTLCVEGWLKDLRALRIVNLGPTRKPELTLQTSPER